MVVLTERFMVTSKKFVVSGIIHSNGTFLTPGFMVFIDLSMFICSV